ncbi:MAG: hypothetical protein JWP19_2232 [Rhodoglobus sp.]|nr:hypothetical protein [Rhodoglobus sp.]
MSDKPQADGDLPDDDPVVVAAMNALSDEDPEIVAGMARLVMLREQEDRIRDLPTRGQS